MRSCARTPIPAVCELAERRTKTRRVLGSIPGVGSYCLGRCFIVAHARGLVTVDERIIMPSNNLKNPFEWLGLGFVQRETRTPGFQGSSPYTGSTCLSDSALATLAGTSPSISELAHHSLVPGWFNVKRCFKQVAISTPSSNASWLERRRNKDGSAAPAGDAPPMSEQSAPTRRSRAGPPPSLPPALRLLLRFERACTFVPLRRWSSHPSEAGWLFVSAMLGIVVGDCCWLAALRALGAARTLLVGALKPFVAALMGTLLLRESLSPVALLALALTMAGVVVAAWPQQQVSQPPPLCATRSFWDKRFL